MHKSARHLVQDLKENVFAKEHIAPDGGISRSSFSEAINHRGLDSGFILKTSIKRPLEFFPKDMRN